MVFGWLGVILGSPEEPVSGWYRPSSKSEIRGKTRLSRTEYKNLLTRGTVARTTERLSIALDSEHQHYRQLIFWGDNMLWKGTDGIA